MIMDPDIESEIAKRIELSMSERMVLADEIAKAEKALFRFKESVEEGDYLAMGRHWSEVGMPIAFIQTFLQHKAQEAAQRFIQSQQRRPNG